LVRCPKCGKENPSDVRACVWCGNPRSGVLERLKKGDGKAGWVQVFGFLVILLGVLNLALSMIISSTTDIDLIKTVMEFFRYSGVTIILIIGCALVVIGKVLSKSY
jgi:hypothetical protein